MLIYNRTNFLIYALILISILIRLIAIGTNDLLPEEAYYWNYAAHLDFSYLDHPPMVAVLIKIFTTIFGVNEFGVRIPSILCWLLCAFFSYKLTESMQRGAGIYALLLLSILPFFFVHSLIMTPDLPLIACWSATLYYLSQALLQNKINAWYLAGVWLGFGMISKYTVILLIPATFIYLIANSSMRKWFTKLQPYCALLIATIIFTPVIYWNATHDWISFAFQSTRRLQTTLHFSLHELIGLFVLFLTPIGVWHFVNLYSKKSTSHDNIVSKNSKNFLQIYTLFPLIFFAIFSLQHEIKFNWIGPGMLAIIPWIAIELNKNKSAKIRTAWFATAVFLLLVYTAMLLCITIGQPEFISRKIFIKFYDWNNVAQQINYLASKLQKDSVNEPLIMPLDHYNIASELAFYQTKLLHQGKISHIYQVTGADIFGHNSLMYKYWSSKYDLSHRELLLVATTRNYFISQTISAITTQLSAPKIIWIYNQGKHAVLNKYYYQYVKVSDAQGAAL